MSIVEPPSQNGPDSEIYIDHESMENSFAPAPGVSSPITSLSKTSEDGGSIQSGQPMDSEDRPMTSYRPYSGLYGQTENFSRPSYALAIHPPFAPAGLGQGVTIIGSPGGGAFKPVASSSSSRNKETQNDEHLSAFTPTKRSKQTDDDTRQSGLNTSSVTRQWDPSSTLEGESSGTNGTEGTTLSDVNNEITAEGSGRQTPDERRSLRSLRKKPVLDSQQHCCPLCGLTLRPGEVNGHLLWEMDKLDKIPRPGRKSGCKDLGLHVGKVPASSSGSSGGGRKGSGRDGEHGETHRTERHETYQRIKSNRQARLCARGRKRRKAVEETTCPVCEKKVSGTPEELVEHVDLCLKTREDGSDDGDLDVDGEPPYEEYEWCGQTRIRSTTLLPGGGLAAAGFQTGSKAASDDDDDLDLDVDGDDTENFGQPQYSEADLILCSSELPSVDKETRALRRAYIRSEMQQVNSIPSERRRWDSRNEVNSGGPEEAGQSTSDQGDRMEGSPAQPQATETAISEEARNMEEVIASLKARIREQEELLGRDRPKCLICMEPYQIPLASTQCWHVHCEECWLRTLGAKKLCPQCNTITSPVDLRRIFL